MGVWGVSSSELDSSWLVNPELRFNSEFVNPAFWHGALVCPSIRVMWTGSGSLPSSVDTHAVVTVLILWIHQLSAEVHECPLQWRTLAFEFKTSQGSVPRHIPTQGGYLRESYWLLSLLLCGLELMLAQCGPQWTLHKRYVGKLHYSI